MSRIQSGEPSRRAYLQWGRGLGAAECLRRAFQTRGVTILQWGRGLGAAEWTRRAGSSPRSTASFNGAAA